MTVLLKSFEKEISLADDPSRSQVQYTYIHIIYSLSLSLSLSPRTFKNLWQHWAKRSFSREQRSVRGGVIWQFSPGCHKSRITWPTCMKKKKFVLDRIQATTKSNRQNIEQKMSNKKCKSYFSLALSPHSSYLYKLFSHIIVL